MTNVDFSDLWPKYNEPLIYIGADKPGYFTHGNEYQVKHIVFIPCADLIHVVDDSGFMCQVELVKFSLVEKNGI